MGCQANASVCTVFLGVDEGMSALHPSGLLARCSPVGCLWPKEGQTHFSWAACWTVGPRHFTVPSCSDWACKSLGPGEQVTGCSFLPLAGCPCPHALLELWPPPVFGEPLFRGQP